MRVLVLLNPRSGTSRRRSRAQKLFDRLRTDGATMEIVAPGSAEETRERAGRATRSSYDVLLVSGGDGTVSAAVNGLVRTAKANRPALAIVPSGRGNDFAAELGIRGSDDTLLALSRRKSRLVDLGRSEAGVFLGVAGTGFDAQAARCARETRLLSGGSLYTYAVLRTLVNFRPLGARVVWDGGSFEGLVTFAAVGNSTRYGGGMRITPEAELTDGLVDLCLVEEVSRSTLLIMFPTVFFGAHLSHPRVQYRKSRWVRIETDEPADVFADGELLQRTPVTLEALPGELEVLTPPS